MSWLKDGWDWLQQQTTEAFVDGWNWVTDWTGSPPLVVGTPGTTPGSTAPPPDHKTTLESLTDILGKVVILVVLGAGIYVGLKLVKRKG